MIVRNVEGQQVEEIGKLLGERTRKVVEGKI